MQEQEMDVFSSMKDSGTTGIFDRCCKQYSICFNYFLCCVQRFDKKLLKEEGLTWVHLSGLQPAAQNVEQQWQEVAGRLQLVNTLFSDFNLGHQPMQWRHTYT